MERISFIVERLNMPPFSKGFATMADLDSKSSLELLEITCEIIVEIDPDQQNIFQEQTEHKVHRIVQFLLIMKFNIPEDQMEDFHGLLLSGDTEILHTVMHWCLQRLDHLKKRAYLSKYLMPLEVPPEFLNEDLIIELSQSLKEMQIDFKGIHKAVDQLRGSGTRPAELKAEITQLEQERIQLQSKIQLMKKNSKNEGNFEEMLKVTSALRKEQEEDVRIHERLREYKKGLQEAEGRLADTNRRLSEVRGGGAQSQTAEQLLAKLQKDVRELADRREILETSIADREIHLEKLHSWNSSDRMTTEDDVRSKRDQVRDMEDQVASLHESLEAALERNTKLVVFKQASTIALKKMREKEDEVDKITDEKRRIAKQSEDKEGELRAQGKLSGNGGKMGKQDLKKYGAVVKEKIERYKKMREELSTLRGELVVLQRTEQILRSRDRNVEDFLTELERKKGIEGYRETQKSLIEMAERTAEVDQMKGATLEQISSMVEEIGREFKSKQSQLNPLMAELKKVRQDFMDVESEYMERKNTYDKVAVALEMDKTALEKECDTFQDECLREESRFHLLTSQCSITRIKLDRAEQEKKWLAGQGRLFRDFASFKDLYANKLIQQDQLTKQLRKRQKDLKENAGAMTNQKTNFANLQALLMAKVRCEHTSAQGSRNGSADNNGYNNRGDSAGRDRGEDRGLSQVVNRHSDYVF